jgi:hypothetical protein
VFDLALSYYLILCGALTILQITPNYCQLWELCDQSDYLILFYHWSNYRILSLVELSYLVRSMLDRLLKTALYALLWTLWTGGHLNFALCFYILLQVRFSIHVRLCLVQAESCWRYTSQRLDLNQLVWMRWTRIRCMCTVRVLWHCSRRRSTTSSPLSSWWSTTSRTWHRSWHSYATRHLTAQCHRTLTVHMQRILVHLIHTNWFKSRRWLVYRQQLSAWTKHNLTCMENRTCKRI